MKKNKINVIAAAVIILMAIFALCMAINADHAPVMEMLKSLGM